MPLLIKQYLKAHKVTMNDLAERMNKSQPAVSLQVNGNPALSSIEEMATALDCEPSDLFYVPDGYTHWTQKAHHDALTARITALEAQNAALLTENAQLKCDIATMKEAGDTSLGTGGDTPLGKGESSLYHCPHCGMVMQVVTPPSLASTLPDDGEPLNDAFNQ